MGMNVRLCKVDIRPQPGSIVPMNAMLPFPDIAPEIFTISFLGMTFALRWYALAYIVGILIGWRLSRRALLRPRHRFPWRWRWRKRSTNSPGFGRLMKNPPAAKIPLPDPIGAAIKLET